MVKLVLLALAFGLLGAIVVPVVTFFGSRLRCHAIVAQGGTPGDSGGCEMSAGVIGLGSAIPGFLIGVAVALHRGHKRRRAQSRDAG